jgi:hypothetical protein
VVGRELMIYEQSFRTTALSLSYGYTDMKSDRIVCNTDANELIVHMAPKTPIMTLMVFIGLF